MHITKTYTILFQFFTITLCMMIVSPNMMASEFKKIESSFTEYSFGRFVTQVPNEFARASNSFAINYTKVKELAWKNPGDHTDERDSVWRNLLSTIKSEELPDGAKDHVLEEKDFSASGIWGKGVLSYSDPYDNTVISWTVLRDYKSHGVIFSIEGTIDHREIIDEIFNKVVEDYIPNTSSGDKNKFILIHGVIPLERRGEEKVYIRFESEPLESKLEIETKVVSKVEKTNIIERLTAALAANFAPGVSVDKIRTEQRTVAGLKGDEVIMRGTEGKKSELSFAWRFNGEKNSATAPRITIEMESPDGQLEKKLAIWDAVLNSMQVIPQD